MPQVDNDPCKNGESCHTAEQSWGCGSKPVHDETSTPTIAADRSVDGGIDCPQAERSDQQVNPDVGQELHRSG